jgi:poly-gamma-glutamate synthesis protein (capsule biosynthesis protein)
MKRPTLHNVLGLLLAGTIALLGHSAAVAQPVPPTKDESGWVTLVFAGDIVLDDVAGAMIERGEDPFGGFRDFFAKADIRIGNLECVVATTGSAGDKNFTFRAHPRTLPVLKRHFDALALANNHSGDYGREAFAEMLTLLPAAGLQYFGGGRNLKEAHAPLILERKGLRIALLSYNEFMPRSFEADFDAPGIAWSEDEQVVADIRAARAVHRADLVIPVMHWGWENELVANSRQRSLARRMVDAGADAVIGGHPHVTQDIDYHQGKPIVYSVGNFVMKETDNDDQRRAWVLKLRLSAQGVQAFETRAVNIDLQGIPTPDPTRATPCWRRGEADTRLCTPTD